MLTEDVFLWMQDWVGGSLAAVFQEQWEASLRETQGPGEEVAGVAEPSHEGREVIPRGVPEGEDLGHQEEGEMVQQPTVVSPRGSTQVESGVASGGVAAPGRSAATAREERPPRPADPIWLTTGVARGGAKALLKGAQELADRIGLVFYDRKVEGRTRFVQVKWSPKRNDARQRSVGPLWGYRDCFWPFCSRNASDPITEEGPYPGHWEAELARRILPRMLLEWDHHRCRARQSSRGQRAREMWEWFYDHYPWCLPEEISRPPYWAEREAARLTHVPLIPPE